MTWEVITRLAGCQLAYLSISGTVGIWELGREAGDSDVVFKKVEVWDIVERLLFRGELFRETFFS